MRGRRHSLDARNKRVRQMTMTPAAGCNSLEEMVWDEPTLRRSIRRMLASAHVSAYDVVLAWDRGRDGELAETEFLSNLRHFFKAHRPDLWRRRIEPLARRVFNRMARQPTDSKVQACRLSVPELEAWLRDSDDAGVACGPGHRAGGSPTNESHGEPSTRTHAAEGSRMESPHKRKGRLAGGRGGAASTQRPQARSPSREERMAGRMAERMEERMADRTAAVTRLLAASARMLHGGGGSAGVDRHVDGATSGAGGSPRPLSPLGHSCVGAPGSGHGGYYDGSRPLSPNCPPCPAAGVHVRSTDVMRLALDHTRFYMDVERRLVRRTKRLPPVSPRSCGESASSRPTTSCGVPLYRSLCWP